MVLVNLLTSFKVWAADPTKIKDPAEIKDLELIITNILGLVIPVVGILLLLMLIAGGFQYITSGGEAEQAQKAKKTLTYAIFGLLVVLGAWFIIRLLEEFTGLNLTTFTIPR
ncbi:MAG: hypothetical protein XD95_0732 [Microgenomates bacterium 39_7]|nr:MAG: hypothetical protein XD95_0732 [Microgenomates bacterium 39_7]